MELTKDILEIIYYLTAGPLLVLIAFKGLNQIKIAKETSRTNNKREAFKSAAEQCGIYADKIIPLVKGLKNEKLNFFDKFNVNLTNKGFNIKVKEEIIDDDINALNTSQYLTDLGNSLEGYAVYFNSGVAAEKVGFITTGRSYCNVVKMILPVIGPEFKKGNFKNLMILFFKWNNRIEKDKLEVEKKEINRKLSQQGNGMDISPIGMEK
jgi:hypothetical protein